MAFRMNTLLVLAAAFLDTSLVVADANVVKGTTLRGSGSASDALHTVFMPWLRLSRKHTKEDPELVIKSVGNATTSATGEVDGVMPDELLPTPETMGLGKELEEQREKTRSAPWHEALTRNLALPGLPTIHQISDKLDAINDTLDQVDVLVGMLNSSVNDLVSTVVNNTNKTMDALQQISDAAQAAAAFGGEEIGVFISSFTLYMSLQVQDLQSKMLIMVKEQIYDKLDIVRTRFLEIKEEMQARFDEAIDMVLAMVKTAADRLPSADVSDDASNTSSSLLQASAGPSADQAFEKLEVLNKTVYMVSNLLAGLNLTAVDMVVTGVVGAAQSNLQAIDSQCYSAVEDAGGAVPDAVKPMMQILCSAPLKLLDAIQPKIEEVISMVSAKVQQAITALQPLVEAVAGLSALADASQQV